jgi:hypothetical protein
MNSSILKILAGIGDANKLIFSILIVVPAKFRLANRTWAKRDDQAMRMITASSWTGFQLPFAE